MRVESGWEWSRGCERSVMVEADGLVWLLKESVAADFVCWGGNGNGKSVGVGDLLLLTNLRVSLP